jgi:hypothetical protein
MAGTAVAPRSSANTPAQLAAIGAAVNANNSDENDDSLLIKALLALIMAQSGARKTITRGAVESATTLARQMDDADWRDFGAVTRYAAANTKVVAARQRQMAAVTNAYQTRVLTLLTGKPVAPAKQVDVTALRGIPQESVYGRIADHYRYLVDYADVPKTPAVAQKLVVARAQLVAEMDIHLASRAQNQQVMKQKPQVKYYRRVIHPELANSGVSCGLCIVASHNTYAKADLLPIHFRCHCEVVPVTDETRDYGVQINQDDLNALYAAAGGTESQKLKETRFSIHEHGELGPTLTYKGDRFRGPSQVADDTTHGKELPDL